MNKTIKSTIINMVHLKLKQLKPELKPKNKEELIFISSTLALNIIEKEILKVIKNNEYLETDERHTQGFQSGVKLAFKLIKDVLGLKGGK